MTDLINIIEKRAAPGGFIFDLEQRLICANRKAMEIIPVVGKKRIMGEEMSGLCPMRYIGCWTGCPAEPHVKTHCAEVALSIWL